MPDQDKSHQRAVRKVEQEFQQWTTTREPQETVVVGVSGGVDSMVLLHLLSKSSLTPIAAHCNFHLRPPDCDLDQALVEKFCAEHQLLVELTDFATQDIQKKEGGGIQEIARNLRYNWFTSLTQKYSAPLLTAHHAVDRIETILFNWKRGCGLQGLVAMGQENGRALRPLINLSKSDLRAYAVHYQVPFREDLSNQSLKYERNWFRNALLEPLFSRFPASLNTMTESIVQWESEVASYHELLQLQLEKGIKKLAYNREQLVFPERCSIDLQRSLVYHWLQEQGITRDTLSKLDPSANGKSFGLRSGAELVVERDGLVLVPENWSNLAMLDVALLQNEVVISAGLFAPNDVKEVRTWRAGDEVVVRGKTKKVADYLNELKVPLHLKTKWPLGFKNGKCVWISGLFE